jgi:hypothetical protein
VARGRNQASRRCQLFSAGSHCSRETWARSHHRLVGTVNPRGVQPVGGDRIGVPAAGRTYPKLSPLRGPESFPAYQAGDAISAVPTSEGRGQSGTAVGLAAEDERLADLLAQDAVLAFLRPGRKAPPQLVIIAAAQHQQGLAPPPHLLSTAHRLDLGIPLGGASERMPTDFLGLRAARAARRSARSAGGSAAPAHARGQPKLLGPAIEQRGPHAELRCHRGPDAATVLPVFERLLPLLCYFERLARSWLPELGLRGVPLV